MIRVIVIDALKREVREEQVKGKTLKFLQKTCGGYVDLVRITDYADLWVKDEGLIDGTQEFFTIGGVVQPLAGSGVLASSDEDGNTIGTDIPLDIVKDMVGFVDKTAMQHIVKFAGELA